MNNRKSLVIHNNSDRHVYIGNESSSGLLISKGSYLELPTSKHPKYFTFKDQCGLYMGGAFNDYGDWVEFRILGVSPNLNTKLGRLFKEGK